MPQIAKGGKYIFGWSPVSRHGSIQIPPEARDEYGLIPGGKVLLTSGSQATGGFTVTTRSLLQASALASILDSCPDLAEYRLDEGQTVRYKGRSYCWAGFSPDGRLQLSAKTLAAYDVKEGDRLLSIRGSNLAFVMGVRGPLIAHANTHPEILVFP
ncbi:MAG: hypothetical protein ACOYYS_25930 [Chloroflexota bacterium]